MLVVHRNEQQAVYESLHLLETSVDQVGKFRHFQGEGVLTEVGEWAPSLLMQLHK